MSVKIADTAKFTHDCDACVFLGHSLSSDLYFCNGNGNISTVIARWSSDGPDYTSGIALVPHDVRLAAALGLATQRGLY